MNNKYKNIWIILFTVLISGIIFVVQFCHGQHMNYYIYSFSHSMSLDRDRVNDVDLSDDNHIRITGEDPYLVYSLPEQGDYLNCKVIFSDETSDAPLQLHVYYADGISAFAEDKTIDVSVDAFSDNVSFSLPGNIGSVQYIRIDFENTLSSVPVVRFVGLQDDSLLSRLVSFFLGSAYNYLFIIPVFIVVFISVYRSRNWKNNVLRYFAAIAILWASCFLLVHIINNYKEETLFPIFSDEKYIVDMELGDINLMNDVEASAHGYKIVGGDAFVQYNIGIPYGRGVRVRFENPFENPGIIQFFYAEPGYGFSEKNSVRVSVDTEQEYVDIPVSLSDIDTIRIDVDAAENTEFKIVGLQLDVGNNGYIEILYNAYTWICVVFFVLIIGMVLANRKVYFEDKSCLFTVIAMLVSVVLVTLMSSQSKLINVHPDELVTKLAIDYYLNHWLPPDVRSVDIRNTFSVYGNTRLHELNVYYFLAGKIGLFFKEVCHCIRYYRIFNYLLYIIMIGIVIYNIKKESWLIIAVALTPQLWYIFSYATSDAWDFFCSFLLIYQAVARDSILNMALGDRCGCRKRIMAYTIFGALSAFIIMGKYNYYVILLLLFTIFLFKLFKSQKKERINLLKKYLLILVFFGGVLILRYSVNLYYYGFNENEIYSQIKEERARYDFKETTPVEEQYRTLHLKEKGVTLQELFHEYKFWMRSYKSFVGVFGYLNHFCSNAYYWIMGFLLTMLLFVVYLFALKKKSEKDALEIFIITIIMCLSVILSIYNSWYLDFQPQGRYLLPMIICFSYIASKGELNTIMRERITIGLIGTIQILACVAFYKYGILEIAL